jgi:acyl-CoA thioesterase-1
VSTRILCLGDSLTYGYGSQRCCCWTRLVQERTGLTMTNRGVCGDTLSGMRSRLDGLLGLKPELCIILGGTNDILSGRAPAERDIATLADACLSSGVRPVIATPTPIDRLNIAPHWTVMTTPHRAAEMLEDYVRLLRGFAEEQKLPLIDLYAALGGADEPSGLFVDGLHLTPRGNELVADAVCALLDKLK